MIDLENIFYYTVFQITNDATVFWLEYCEDTFKTISKFDEDLEKPSLRFSFSKFNTKEEIDYTLSVVEALFVAKTV